MTLLSTYARTAWCWYRRHEVMAALSVHSVASTEKSAADTCLLVPSGLQSHAMDLLLSAPQTV